MQAPSSLRPVLTLPAQPALRFRLLDSDAWLDGQVEDLSRNSICFLTDLPLELGAELEVVLPVSALAPLRAYGPPQRARVVSRVLDRWPDLRTAVTAVLSELPGTHFAGAA